jgi:hypothetical protein
MEAGGDAVHIDVRERHMHYDAVPVLAIHGSRLWVSAQWERTVSCGTATAHAK